MWTRGFLYTHLLHSSEEEKNTQSEDHCISYVSVRMTMDHRSPTSFFFFFGSSLSVWVKVKPRISIDWNNSETAKSKGEQLISIMKKHDNKIQFINLYQMIIFFAWFQFTACEMRLVIWLQHDINFSLSVENVSIEK